MKLRTQLFSFFLLVALVPLGCLSVLSLWQASVALSDSAFNRLTAINQTKLDALGNYFVE